MNEKGKLFVISGPSGAGKSTVVFKAMEGRDDLCFSTSVTTRKPRPGEVDGREYFFVDLERFDEMVKNNELLEHAVLLRRGKYLFYCVSENADRWEDTFLSCIR